MANANRFQLLINSYNNVSGDEARDIRNMAEEAATAIPLGIAAVGNLIFQATENPEYDPEDMRLDMFNIGLLMRCLGNFQVALTTTKENAEFAIRKHEKELSNDQ
ncbi:TPA: hypothetical protein JAV72_002973 [Citrobacter braakii]|nr:hypothetical protein [Citrobacter braakii]